MSSGWHRGFGLKCIEALVSGVAEADFGLLHPTIDEKNSGPTQPQRTMELWSDADALSEVAQEVRKLRMNQGC